MRRWYKALYLTPALFPIYFRAAAREAATYDDAISAAGCAVQRVVVIGIAPGRDGGSITLAWGWPMLLKLYVVPVFFVFPIAFTINRLGQHYDIEPDDPAAWGTLIRTNPVWDFLFLWSNYHMEHHYFPNVSRSTTSRRCTASCRPVFERHPMRVRTYGGLLWDWFVKQQGPALELALARRTGARHAGEVGGSYQQSAISYQWG